MLTYRAFQLALQNRMDEETEDVEDDLDDDDEEQTNS